MGLMSKRKNGKQLIWSHKDRSNIKWCENIPVKNCDDLAAEAGVRTIEKLEIEKMMTRGQETIDELGRKIAESSKIDGRELVDLIENEEVNNYSVRIFGAILNGGLCLEKGYFW